MTVNVASTVFSSHHSPQQTAATTFPFHNYRKLRKPAIWRGPFSSAIGPPIVLHTALSVQLCVRLCQLAWETNDLGVHRKELGENHRKGPAACHQTEARPQCMVGLTGIVT